MRRSGLVVGGALAVVTAFGSPSTGREECRWVETKGEAALEHVTAEEARHIAVRAARARAVEQVAGVELQAQSLIRNQLLVAQFLRALTHGFVLEEKVLRWEQEAFQDAPERAPVTLYRVHLRACVSPITAERDPYFTVSAELNRATFMAGDEAQLKVRCNRDCYLTIFNMQATDHFSILLPNSYDPTAFVRESETLVFPPPGVALVMRPVIVHRRDTEAFLIVATKRRLDAHTRLGRREAIPLGDVFRVLLGLPASERAEALVAYDVTAR